VTPDDFVGREDEDVANVIFFARVRKGKTTTLTPRPFRRGWVTQTKPEPKRVREPKPAPIEERDKVHPVLKQLMETGRPDERHELMVVFRENIVIPRFPEPDDRQAHNLETNQRLRRRADELVKEITAKRQAENEMRCGF
jgi:hypothetical protein